jgi:hypothetical protein
MELICQQAMPHHRAHRKISHYSIRQIALVKQKGFQSAVIATRGRRVLPPAGKVIDSPYAR